MSKSVKDYTGFTANVNSEEGIARQNARLCFAGVLRLFLVCLFVCFLSFVVSAVSYAQPGWTDVNPFSPTGWWTPVESGTGAGQIALPDGFPGGAPYERLWWNEANVTGGNRWTGQYVRLTGSVRGVATGTGRSTHWWVGSSALANSDSDALFVDGGSIYQLAQLTVQGNLRNSGAIYNIGVLTYSSVTGLSDYTGVHVRGNAMNLAGARIGGTGSSDWLYVLSVDQTLTNRGPHYVGDDYRGRAEITNVGIINAGILENYGLIRQIPVDGSNRFPVAYINVNEALINGNNLMRNPDFSFRERRSAEIIAPWNYVINAGNLYQYFDGSIRAHGGIINVSGMLYNAGEIRVDWHPDYVRGTIVDETWWDDLVRDDLELDAVTGWDISAHTIVNDGRLWRQHTEGLFPRSGVENEAWGIIYDAVKLQTIGSLTNWGANAVINGSVETNDGSFMLVGGNLHNLDRASLFNYQEITVYGDFENRGATFVGGSWFRHNYLVTNDANVLQRKQTGHIDVRGNVINHSEDAWEEFIGTGRRIFGGLIASFDRFDIGGSLYNDAHSMITGSYTHQGTAPWQQNYEIVPFDGVIHGRRASILGGVMLEGNNYQTTATILNVMGLRPENQTGSEGFYGLYNEGHIQEIDILSVGSNEEGVLWNAFAVAAPRASLPTSNGQENSEGLIGTPGTITDIGVIHATNLINSGTISDIDTSINVSYLLWNEGTGVLNGFSESHVQWVYMPDGAVSGFLPEPVTLADGRVVYEAGRYEVMVPTRADLRVGRSTAENPFAEEAEVAGVGIVNQGLMTNFETIASRGTMVNSGVSTVDAFGNVITPRGISNVTSITVGSNMTGGAADFHNAGSLLNVARVAVTRDLFVELGSSFGSVGTITAGRHVRVNGMIDGGFRILAAESGTLSTAVGGLLGVDRGAIAAGNVVSNSGYMENRGTLTSNGSVTNEMTGVMVNNGIISSFSNVTNFGHFSGNGMVFISSPSGRFDNAVGGTVSGRLTVNGNFMNYGGTIELATGDIIRVVNGRATIGGGTVDASAYEGVVGRQYLFLATDKPGDLVFSSSQPLTVRGSNVPGSVLNFVPTFGSWDGTRYVAGEMWLRDNQYYWLEVRRAYEYGRHAQTGNQRAVGEYIDKVSTSARPTGALWNMLQQLDGISDGYYNGSSSEADAFSAFNVQMDRRDNPHFDPDYASHVGESNHVGINPRALRALEEIGGKIYANLGSASVNNAGAINRTLGDVLRSDVFKFSMIGNPNNAIRGQAIAPLRYTRWGTVFGTSGTTKHDGNTDGFKSSFGGVMAGVDRALWTGTRIGAYLSAAAGDVSMRELNESSDITNVSVGLYLRQEMYYGYGLVSAGFGWDSYDTERHLTMIRHRAESKTHATIGTAYLERGMDIPVYYATVQPYVSFQIVSVNQDSFTERMWDQSGRYANVGLEGVKGKTNSFKMGLGTRASSQPIPMRWGQLALTGNMAWFHDFQGDADRNFVARFSNPGNSNFSQSSDATFKIDSNNPKRDWFNLGLGLNMDRNSTRIFLSGDLFTNSRQTLVSGGGGVSTSW